MLALVACSPQLPSNFASMSLHDQVNAYASYRQNHIHQSHLACEQISVHGMAAADLMADVIEKGNPQLNKLDALTVIRLVQLRGCDLRSSRPEEVIRAAIRLHTLSTVEMSVASHTLRIIKDQKRWAPELFSVKGQPCG
jgi:hypothetical protein